MGISARGEEEHRPSQRTGRLVFRELDVGPREPCQHRDGVVAGRGRFDLLEPASQVVAAGRVVASVTVIPA